MLSIKVFAKKSHDDGSQDLDTAEKKNGEADID